MNFVTVGHGAYYARMIISIDPSTCAKNRLCLMQLAEERIPLPVEPSWLAASSDQEPEVRALILSLPAVPRHAVANGYERYERSTAQVSSHFERWRRLSDDPDCLSHGRSRLELSPCWRQLTSRAASRRVSSSTTSSQPVRHASTGPQGRPCGRPPAASVLGRHRAVERPGIARCLAISAGAGAGEPSEVVVLDGQRNLRPR